VRGRDPHPLSLRERGRVRGRDPHPLSLRERGRVRGKSSVNPRFNNEE
jgi:hypothetical protein